MLKLEQLYYLQLVYRFDSIKLAAAEIPCTPSAVSAALHKMEKELGLKLMERTYRGIELTDTAERIVQNSDAVFRALDELEGIIEAERQKLQMRGQGIDHNDNKLSIYLSRGHYQGGLITILDYMDKLGIDAQVPDLSCGNEVYLKHVNEDPDTVLINFFSNDAEKILSEYENVESIRIKKMKPCIYCANDCPFIDSNLEEIAPEVVAKLPILLFQEGFDLALPICEMLET